MILEDSPAFVWSLFYLLFVFCQLLPPAELVTAGLTTERILFFLLGREHTDFVAYHIKRTSLNWLVHWCLPLAYFVGLFCTEDLVTLWHVLWFRALFALSIVVAARALIVVWLWSRNGWTGHPIARDLATRHAGGAWRQLASQINHEFCSVDKFISLAAGIKRVVITDSFLLHSSAYTLHISPLCRLHLHLERASTSVSGYQSTTGLDLPQTLVLRVASVQSDVKPFHITILSNELSEVSQRLGRQVTNLRQIVLQQTLTDRFVDEFCRVLDDNLPVFWGQEVELCIGCDERQAEVRLVRQCVPGRGCQRCNCRPMWCQLCFAKWFASRQDRTAPHTWLASTCPCPTCRSTFCLLDVRRIITRNSAVNAANAATGSTH